MDENFRSSPVYQRTLEKGKSIVFERFSSLARIAREVLAAINDPGLLLLIVVKLAQIQSTEEAQEFLLCLHPQFVDSTRQESRALP